MIEICSPTNSMGFSRFLCCFYCYCVCVCLGLRLAWLTTYVSFNCRVNKNGKKKPVTFLRYRNGQLCATIYSEPWSSDCGFKNAVLLHEMPRLLLLLLLSLLFAIVDCNCQICLCFVVFNVVGQHPHHFISSYTRVFVSQTRKRRKRDRERETEHTFRLHQRQRETYLMPFCTVMWTQKKRCEDETNERRWNVVENRK